MGNKPKDNVIVKPVTPKDGESCSLCLRRSEKYNGWSNYETWSVALWLDNEEHTQRYWTDLGKQALEDSQESHEEWNTPREEATHELAKRLEDEVKEGIPDIENSMYLDLLRAAVGSVDWYEIAGHYVEEQP